MGIERWLILSVVLSKIVHTAGPHVDCILTPILTGFDFWSIFSSFKRFRACSDGTQLRFSHSAFYHHGKAQPSIHDQF